MLGVLALLNSDNSVYHDLTGHDPNNYLARIPLSKYFFGAASPLFKNLNLGNILGKFNEKSLDNDNSLITYGRLALCTKGC